MHYLNCPGLTNINMQETLKKKTIRRVNPCHVSKKSHEMTKLTMPSTKAGNEKVIRRYSDLLTYSCCLLESTWCISQFDSDPLIPRKIWRKNCRPHWSMVIKAQSKNGPKHALKLRELLKICL